MARRMRRGRTGSRSRGSLALLARHLARRRRASWPARAALAPRARIGYVGGPALWWRATAMAGGEHRPLCTRGRKNRPRPALRLGAVSLAASTRPSAAISGLGRRLGAPGYPALGALISDFGAHGPIGATEDKSPIPRVPPTSQRMQPAPLARPPGPQSLPHAAHPTARTTCASGSGLQACKAGGPTPQASADMSPQRPQIARTQHPLVAPAARPRHRTSGASGGRNANEAGQAREGDARRLLGFQAAHSSNPHKRNRATMAPKVTLRPQRAATRRTQI